jgi:hypothetical protein
MGQITGYLAEDLVKWIVDFAKSSSCAWLRTYE